MKKHKKILVVFLLAVCVLFAGCSARGDVSLMQLPNGTIMETYTIPVAEYELEQAGVTELELAKIKNLAKTELNKVFNNYLQAYKTRIEQSTSYTNEQKTELLNGVKIYNSLDNNSDINISFSPDSPSILKQYITKIEYSIVYNNSTCFLEFKNANSVIDQPKTVVTEKSLFTTTTKVIKDPVFDNIASESITLGKHVISKIDEIVVASLATDISSNESIEIAKQRWSAIKTTIGFSSASEYFTYCYYVPSARYKSNANKVHQQYYNDVGTMYIHEWQVPVNNTEQQQPLKFEYWTTTANKAVWYGFATLGAGIVMLVVYIVAKKQEKQQISKSIEEITKDI